MTKLKEHSRKICYPVNPHFSIFYSKNNTKNAVFLDQKAPVLTLPTLLTLLTLLSLLALLSLFTMFTLL